MSPEQRLSQPQLCSFAFAFIFVFNAQKSRNGSGGKPVAGQLGSWVAHTHPENRLEWISSMSNCDLRSADSRSTPVLGAITVHESMELLLLLLMMSCEIEIQIQALSDTDTDTARGKWRHGIRTPNQLFLLEASSLRPPSQGSRRRSKVSWVSRVSWQQAKLGEGFVSRPRDNRWWSMAGCRLADVMAPPGKSIIGKSEGRSDIPAFGRVMLMAMKSLHVRWSNQQG